MIRLGLFFTYGHGLGTWEERGFLSRELHYYQYLRRHGIETIFFTYDTHESFQSTVQKEAFPVVVLNSKKNRLSKLWRSFYPEDNLNSIFKKLDLVKTNQMWGSWSPRRIAKKFQKPFLLRCGFEAYQNSVSQGDSILRQWILRRESQKSYSQADRVILTAPSSFNFVKEKFRVDPQRVTIIPNYIDTSTFRDLSDDRSSRFLFVGRFSQEKNIDLILKACSHADQSISLIGTGPLLDQMKVLAQALKVDARFLGKVPHEDLPKVMNQHRALILYSSYEGNPKVVLEAMACGLPVIGANVRGIQDLLEDGMGDLIDPGNLSQLANCILNFKVDQKRLGQVSRAKNKIETHFSLDAIVKAEKKVISTLV